MNRTVRYLRWFFLSAILLLGLVAGINWRVDPLQHYRAPGYRPLLVEQGRFRNPGLARHTKAPLIVAGTSVSVHQRAAELQRIFGLASLNVAMEGASAHEQYLILRLALRTGAVREVIWDVNFEYLRGAPDWVSDYDGAFPAYLYDDSKWNDVPNYLLSLDVLKNSVRVLTKKYPTRTLDDFSKLDPSIPYGAEAIAKKMERRRTMRAKFRAMLPEFTAEQLRVSFERNYVALIREFPQVKFRLYCPPFSATYFDFLREILPEAIPVFLQHREDLAAAVKGLPNAELHDLQGNLPLITDAAHYGDPIHFDPATHVRVLEMIHAGSELGSPERRVAFREFIEKGRP